MMMIMLMIMMIESFYSIIPSGLAPSLIYAFFPFWHHLPLSCKSLSKAFVVFNICGVRVEEGVKMASSSAEQAAAAPSYWKQLGDFKIPLWSAWLSSSQPLLI